MDRILEVITTLPPLLVLALVFVLPALESSTLLGLIVPGELAILVGGVVAHGGRLPLWAVIAAATIGAVLGDQVGYLIGRHRGPAVLKHAPRRLRRSGELDRILERIRTRGAITVIVGRWTTVVRVLIPAIAGSSGMRRSTFTAANLAGGLFWAAAVAVFGYLGGASYRYLERRLSIGGEILLTVFIIWAAIWVWRQRRAARRRD